MNDEYGSEYEPRQNAGRRNIAVAIITVIVLTIILVIR